MKIMEVELLVTLSDSVCRKWARKDLLSTHKLKQTDPFTKGAPLLKNILSFSKLMLLLINRECCYPFCLITTGY